MRFDKLFLEKALENWQDMPNTEWLEIVQNKLESSLGLERFIELCKSGKKMVIKFGIIQLHLISILDMLFQ